MSEPQPGVRRLCVAALTCSQQSAGFVVRASYTSAPRCSMASAAPLRVRALLRDPAIHRAVAGCQRLAVIMSEGLYDDLHTEGLAVQEWRRIPAAGAWVRG